MLCQLALAALLSCTAIATDRPVKPVETALSAAVVPTQLAISALPPQVRLRKLHLVRPDLIPYPMAYEMYC
jgi:hypothetical protein